MSRQNLLKKTLSLVLVLSMFVGILGFDGIATIYADEDKAPVNVADAAKKLVADIEDTDVKDAVLRLHALGIINGKEDGKYHPEDKVTREEFAKILVSSLNMAEAAKAAQGYGKFKDVEATRWSAGYIEVAAGHDLIKGYPGGNFGPADEVTYSQAITMLVRALGYKDNFLPGTWPGNYLAKAAEKELTKKVKFSDSNGFANRGEVAVLVNNTLDAKVVKVDTYETGTIKYVESEETLLKNKLNIEKIEDCRIIANKRINDGLEEDEVTVREYDKKKKEYSEKDYDFLPNVNPEVLLGEEVSIYLNDDDEIVYVESEHDDRAYFDYINGVGMKGSRVEQLSLVKADDDFDFADNAVIYTLKDDKYKAAKINDDDNTLKDLRADVFRGKVGKFVIKNREIVYAEVMEMGLTDPWLVVIENKNGNIKGICADDDEFEIDLTKDGQYDGVIVLGLDGIQYSVDDIEKGNLIYAQKQSYDGDDYAVVRVVKDNVVEGTLNSIKKEKVNISGKEIKVIKYSGVGRTEYVTYYSIDSGDTIKQFIADKQELIDDMEDADEEEIVAYLDAVGKIAYYVTKAESTSGYKFGVVTRIYADYDRIKVFTIDKNGEGDEIVYRVEEENNVKKNARLLNEYGQKLKDSEYDKEENLTGLKEGSVIKFKLNSDGEIAEDKLYAINLANLWKINTKDDFGKDYLPKAEFIGAKGELATDPTNFGGSGFNAKGEGLTKSFNVKDNAVLIDAVNYKFKKSNDKPTDVAWFKLDGQYLKADIHNADDFEETSWNNLEKSKGIDCFMYVFSDDDKAINAEAVIFIGDASGSAGQDEIGIYIVDRYYKSGDTIVKYMEYGDNEYKTKVLDNDDNDEFKTNRHEHPYIAKVKANDKLEIRTAQKEATKDGFMKVYGRVSDRKSDSLKLENAYNFANDKLVEKNAEYNISSKTLVFEEDTKKNTSNIVKGDIVIIVLENDSARVVERLIDSEKSKMEAKVDKNDGKTDDDTPPATEKGTVTYINADGMLLIDGEDYQVGAATVLYNEKGTVIAVGATAINKALAQNDEVKDVKVENSVVKSLVGTKVASEIKAAADVDALIAALNKPYGEDEVKAARVAYTALTNSQKDLVTKLADLEKAEAALASDKALTDAQTAVEGLFTDGNKSALKDETDQKAINVASAKVEALGKDVTEKAGLQADIVKAQGLLDTKVVKEVENAIDQIATDNGKYTTVEAARTAFNKLTEAQKTKVDAAKVTALEAAETAVANAVKAVNGATTPLTMRNALETNAGILDIVVTDGETYALNKDSVANEMLAGKPFADAKAIKTAFDTALTLLQ